MSVMAVNKFNSTIDDHYDINATTSLTNNIRSIERIAYDIETVYLWIILALGVPGNCATIMTVTKMSPAKSLTVYIALLAVVDNLAIVSKLLMFVLPDNNVHIGITGCTVLGYFGNFLSTLANWLLVALSIERFVAVWLPMKFSQTWTFKKSTITVCLMSFILSMVFLHLFWTMTFVKDNETGMVYCSGRTEYSFFLQRVWFWINVMTYATVPCLLLIIFNVLIIIGISKSEKLNRYLNGCETQSGIRRSERHRQITVMLVMAAFTLVVLTTPRCVILIMSRYYRPPEGTLADSVHYLVDTLAFVLCDFNHAINFYVYSLSAKQFRGQFVELILCRKQKRRKSFRYFSVSYHQSVQNSIV